MKCVICGFPSLYRSKYCFRCRKFTHKHNHAARRVAMVNAIDRTINKFRCYYTNLVLEEEDTKSPFYLTFDHLTPGDESRLVCCAQFVNLLKDAMTEAEFRTNIPNLARKFETGIPLTRDDFKIEHFHSKLAKRSIPHPRDQPEPPDRRVSTDACIICGKPPLKYSYFCARCHHIIRSEHERPAKVPALKVAYDRELDGFRCFYTGIILSLENNGDPFHLSFDHRFPGHPGNIVVCANVINMMKQDLSDAEFITIVKQLAKHFTTGEPFDLAGVKFEYWVRPRAILPA